MNTNYMVPWLFELDTPHGLADFIEYHSYLLSDTSTATSPKHLDHQTVSQQKKTNLQTVAREIGRQSWGARQALAEFIRAPQSPVERELMLKHARPSTSVLIARLSKLDPQASFEALLSRPEAKFAFHDDEEVEIKLLRPELWLIIWQTHKSALQASQREFEREVNFFVDRLTEERNALAEKNDAASQERLQALQVLEDRIFLTGERVSLDVFGD